MEKFQSESGDTAAFTAGIILLVILLILYVFPPPISTDAFYACTVPVRIGAAIWANRIARKQGRELIGWTILAFFFPAVVLLILGWRRKMKTS